MCPQASLSPRSGAMGRKEGSQRAVWPSGCPLRPPRTRPNPPNPGQSAPFASQIGLPERRRGRPNPFALPPPLRKTAHGRSRDPPATAPGNSPGTRRRPPPTPRLQPRNLSLQHRCGPPLHQGDRNPPEQVIEIGGTGDRNRPEQVIEISGMRTSRPAGRCCEESRSGCPCCDASRSVGRTCWGERIDGGFHGCS